MKITLHTTGCPNCRILERKLQEGGIQYQKNYDTEIMLDKGMLTAPNLEIDEKLLSFSDAVKWVNGQKKEV